MDNLRLFIRQQIANLRIKKKNFLLEDEIDKIFWAKVLDHSGIKQQAQILPSVVSETNKPTTGKGIILKYQSFCLEYPTKLKIAIDSDYDYLLDRGNFNIQNHILQTYTYSIENYFCFASSLESLCLKATQSKNEQVFDFESFLTEYSKIIHPLLVISLLYEQNKTQFDEHTFYSITNFCEDVFIDFQLIKIDDVNSTLNKLKIKVEEQLNTLKPNFSNEDIEQIKTTIEAKGVSPENGYLFIKGHFLLENFLSPIVKNITKQLSTEVGFKITDSAVKKTYFNDLNNATPLLQNNFNFYSCSVFNKVKTDISKLENLLS